MAEYRERAKARAPASTVVTPIESVAAPAYTHLVWKYGLADMRLGAEPVRSVWIRRESRREQAGTSCCDDDLRDKTGNPVYRHAKQNQTRTTASGP